MCADTFLNWLKLNWLLNLWLANWLERIAQKAELKPKKSRQIKWCAIKKRLRERCVADCCDCEIVATEANGIM